MKYKITLNWYGELHTLYTSSKRESGASNNAMVQLAAKLGVSKYKVRCYFYGREDKVIVERRD